MNTDTVMTKAAELARDFACDWDARQRRKEADPADFQRLQDLGFHLMAVPVEFGGTWESLAQSARPICTVLRVIARGDPSVSLVSAMHPLVLSAWRVPEVPPVYAQEWNRQRREMFETVLGGAWWGTIVSEPGSGGDISLTTTVARPEPSPHKYRITGQKHFGSGSGITSFMTTRALPEGEAEPDQFYLEVGGVPWDGSTGMKLVAPWEGHGMRSTNSHAFEFKDFPATRVAWPGHQRELMERSGALGSLAFTAVAVGVVDAAMEYARRRLRGSTPQGSSLRSFQKVEWTQAEQEEWLIEQAFEGVLRTFDQGTQDRRVALLGKETIAQLAESVLTRLCKIVGGSAYTTYSPLGAWFEDVRALGYLRPPWALAYDQLFDLSWQE